MSGADYDALLRRRRIWGVPPDVVAHLMAECRREQAELHTHINELDGRLARARAERDAANQATDLLQERVARLEQENQEIANRPETIREEAVRFVVDAWAEAQTLREQSRREIAEAGTKAREEVAVIRRDLIGERQRHEAEMADERQQYETEMTEERQRSEAEIAVLRERRRKAIMDLESLAASLLGQAARGIAPRPTPGASSDAATPDAPHDAPLPISSGGAAEDQLLAKALDDLEAILNASRKSNGE
jgi:hypothetical protein